MNPSQGISPEQRLMRAVIAQTAMEAAGKIAVNSRSPLKAEEARADAIEWFRDAGDDFQRVCSLAGLEPEYVRKRVLAFLEQPEIPTYRRVAGSPGPRRPGPTASDIATLAGVSPSTVNKVRQGRPTQPETRRRVLAAIAELSESERSAHNVH